MICSPSSGVNLPRSFVIGTDCTARPGRSTTPSGRGDGERVQLEGRTALRDQANGVRATGEPADVDPLAIAWLRDAIRFVDRRLVSAINVDVGGALSGRLRRDDSNLAPGELETHRRASVAGPLDRAAERASRRL